MKLKTHLFLWLLIISKISFSQDPIFSQYFLIPETSNPSFSGFMETTYAGVIHRTQWTDLDLRIDTQYGFVNTWSESMNSGIGLSILNHRESNTRYNHAQLNLNYAYRVQLSRDWYFRPAIEVGYGLKSFAFRGLLLSDQINIGSGFVSSASIDPLLENDKVHFFDFNAGLLFHNNNSWLALSLIHI